MSKNSKCTRCGSDCDNECFSIGCWDKCTGCYDTCQLGCVNVDCHQSCDESNCLNYCGQGISRSGYNWGGYCTTCAEDCSNGCYGSGCKVKSSDSVDSYGCWGTCIDAGCSNTCKGGCGFYLNHLYSFIL